MTISGRRGTEPDSANTQGLRWTVVCVDTAESVDFSIRIEQVLQSRSRSHAVGPADWTAAANLRLLQ